MKSKIFFVLSLVTALNPINAMAIGETRKTSEMNPASVKCIGKAKSEWSKANTDVKLEDVIKESRKAANAS